jgi:cysteine-rich repeat protein
MKHLRPAVATTVLVWAMQCACTPPAHAHGGPPDIAFWGPFPSGTTFCLRMLGRAMQTCVDQALAAHRECMDAELAGQPCDEALRDQRINDAKLASRSVVSTACSGGQLTELHFSNPDDARTDVSETCTEQPAAVMSIAYAPVIASGSSAATDEQTRQCLVKTSAYSRKLLRYIVRAKTQVLNLMAVNVFGPAKKNALLKRATDRIAAARAKLAQSILQVCPNFEAMYGRGPAAVLAGLSRVGDCVAGAVYVQTSVACPAPICGNGIKESGEECDDGNTVNDDRCHNDCTTAP